MQYEPVAQSSSPQFTEEEARYLGLDLPVRDTYQDEREQEQRRRFVDSVMRERSSALR